MIAELQQLHERLSEAERAQILNRERQRIAGVLHDHIDQEIFTIGVGLNELLEHDRLDDGLAEQLRHLRQLSIRSSDGLRQAIFALTADQHDGSDLADYLRSLLTKLRRTSGIYTHLSVTGTPSDAVDAVADTAGLVG